MNNSFFDKLFDKKYFIAFAAFIAVFFVHGLQFFKKQTPLVNALLVGLVVYFVAGFLGFKEGAEVLGWAPLTPIKRSCSCADTCSCPPYENWQGKFMECKKKCQ